MNGNGLDSNNTATPSPTPYQKYYDNEYLRASRSNNLYKLIYLDFYQYCYIFNGRHSLW
jgi:hypothetical protein